MEQQDTTGIGWFVAGLGLGALLGVLFAPKAGRETRDELISGARDSKEYVTTRGKQARDQINSVVDRGREQINEYTERGKDVVDKSRERLSGIVDRVAGSQSDTERTRGYRSSDGEEESYRGGTAESRF
jgi:gas vesicle protein